MAIAEGGEVVAKSNAQTLSASLRLRRQELEHTMQQAADVIGTTNATVSRWESNKQIPTKPDQIIPIARYLGISVQDLSTILSETVRRNILAEIARFEG